jgi:hypothetical protein
LGASEDTTDAFAGAYGAGAVALSVEPSGAEAAVVSLGTGLGAAGVDVCSPQASAMALREAIPNTMILCFIAELRFMSGRFQTDRGLCSN